MSTGCCMPVLFANAPQVQHLASNSRLFRHLYKSAAFCSLLLPVLAWLCCTHYVGHAHVFKSPDQAIDVLGLHSLHLRMLCSELAVAAEDLASENIGLSTELVQLRTDKQSNTKAISELQVRQSTMRSASAAYVLAKRAPKYHKLSECKACIQCRIWRQQVSSC